MEQIKWPIIRQRFEILLHKIGKNKWLVQEGLSPLGTSSHMLGKTRYTMDIEQKMVEASALLIVKMTSLLRSQGS